VGDGTTALLTGPLRAVPPRDTFVKLAQQRETLWGYPLVFRKLLRSAEHVQDTLRGSGEVLNFAKPQKMKHPVSCCMG